MVSLLLSEGRVEDLLSAPNWWSFKGFRENLRRIKENDHRRIRRNQLRKSGKKQDTLKLSGRDVAVS